MLRTLKNLLKLFILSGKLDLKKSYSTFEGCVFFSKIEYDQYKKGGS